MSEFESRLKEFEIRQLLDLAHSNFDGGQYVVAEKLATEALNHLGTDIDNLSGRIEARSWLGSAQLAQGKDIEAFESFLWLTSLVSNADYSSLFREDSLSLYHVVEAFGKLVDCGSFLTDIAIEDLFRTIDDGINWLEQIGKTEWLGTFRLRKGILFLRQYKKEQALQELEVALALAHRNPEYINLIECKLTLAEALYSPPQPEFERSLRLLEEALEEVVYPDERYRVYLLEAKVLYEKNLRQKDFDEAFTAAQEALEIARTFQSNLLLSEAYVERGRISAEMEHYQDALDDLNEAERLYPGSSLFALRSSLYLQMERYYEALADINRVLVLNKANPNYWDLSLRGSLYIHMERCEEALVDLNRAIELSEPEPDPWSLNLRGNCYLLVERYDDALVDINRAIELGEPEPDPWGLSQRSEASLSLGRYQEALVDINRAIALEGNGRDWDFYVRANIYRQLGQSEQATENIESAIQILQKEKNNRIDYWRNSFNLALYTLFQGEDASAQAQYEQLIATCPSAVPLQGARRVLKDVLYLHPQHQLARQLIERMSNRITALQQEASSYRDGL